MSSLVSLVTNLAHQRPRAIADTSDMTLRTHRLLIYVAVTYVAVYLSSHQSCARISYNLTFVARRRARRRSWSIIQLMEKHYRHTGLFATLGQYFPNTFYVKTSFSQDELLLGRPGSGTFHKYWYVWSTIIHEWIHHLQFVGTTFGRLHHDLAVNFGPTLCPVIRSILADDSQKIRRPLLRDFLSRVPDPVPLPLMAAATANLMLRGFMGTWHQSIPDISSIIRAPKGEVSPTLSIEGRKTTLGGKEIVEAHARLNEIRYLRDLLRPRTFRTVRRQLDSPQFYWTVSEFVESRLFSSNPSLVRILCDIALNPDWSLENKVDWEEIHPGWRLVKAVSTLERDPRLLDQILRHRDFSSVALGNTIEHEIYSAAGWTRPNEVLERIKEKFPWYADDAISVRSSHPLAFALAMENSEPLVSNFPIRLDFYTPFEVKSTFEPPTEEELKFEYMRMYSVMGSVTIPQMLGGPSLTCPFHGTNFGVKKRCDSGCPIPRFFEQVFGITIEKYLEIPTA